MAVVPVRFYLPPVHWPHDEALIDVGRAADLYFTNTWSNWILQTFLWLRGRGRAVELTKEVPEQGIIVTCSGDLPVMFRPGPRQFVVSISADEGPDIFAQMHIVQNRIQSRIIPDSHYVQHWPQPGLVARDPARGATFNSIAYFGDDRNLCAGLRDSRWPEFLASRGIAWHIRNASSDRNTDFSDVDAVLGVRSFGRPGYIRKPASKLFNAWNAGVPAILGHELAFREQRHSALDYIEVTSFEETCAAVERLAASPDLRREMAENGYRRARELSRDSIVARWEELLFEVAPTQAAGWSARSAAGRKAFFLRCLMEKKVRGAAHRALRALGKETYAI